MITRHLAIGLSLLTLTCAACGDDDDTQISSGLPTSQKLSTLDDDDAKTACQSFARSFEKALPDSELKRAVCTQQAVILSLQAAASGQVDAAVSACQQAASECLEGDPMAEGDSVEDVEIGFPDEDSCDDAEVDDDFATCDATIGEYEVCMNGVVSSLKAQLSNWKCDLLKQDLEELPGFEPPSTDIQECEAVQAKCPGLDPFGDDDDDDDEEDF